MNVCPTNIDIYITYISSYRYCYSLFGLLNYIYIIIQVLLQSVWFVELHIYHHIGIATVCLFCCITYISSYMYCYSLFGLLNYIYIIIQVLLQSVWFVELHIYHHTGIATVCLIC